MTKSEITSFVWNNLKKIDKTNKYHPIVLEKGITFAFNQGYNDIFEKDPRLLDNYTIGYGRIGSELIPTVNSTTELYEVTLPTSYVPFPDKASGVRKVYPQLKATYPNHRFYPMSRHEINVAPDTAFGEIDTRFGYCVRKDTLEFWGTVDFNVTIDIVVPFDEYAATDSVIIPFGKDMQLVYAVIEAMRTMPPVDLKDNNADTQ